jgi:putative transposase
MTCIPSRCWPRRRVVERTLSWITRHRRTVRDCERLAVHHETHVYWATIIVMTRRLARSPAATLVPRQERSALAIRG